MVTFSLPPEDGADGAGSTPRRQTPLPFAKRNYTASPYTGNAGRWNGTPHASSLKRLMPRDDVPSSSLSGGGAATSRNIFRSSNFQESATKHFAPKLPTGTMKKVFAPGATPEPSRFHDDSAFQATPRAAAAKVADKELFELRIASPPTDLTGQVLADKVPKDWDGKGSIYADQYLAHLCPPGLDEEQRRQYFCILDLRRLKYAANEIFASKTWKLNMINFAKEFEKSRSIILLRYGLYEFQTVKPSRDVLKKWRRQHGLPDPEEDEVEQSPSKKATTKKRKADDDMTRDSAAANGSGAKGKRRATHRDEEGDEDDEAPAVSTPASSKNKRKAGASDEQPAKMAKSTPSSAKALFEKIANKPTSAPAPAPAPAPALAFPAASKSGHLTAHKPGSHSLARSVFANLKSQSLQVPRATPAGGNIFGYLSDASSAKNSGVDADAESESETGSDGDESPDAGQSDEPSVAAETASRAGSVLFQEKPAPTGGFGAASADSREGTPARSLFERVTTGSDGQPLRVEEEGGEFPPGKAAAAADQTWNPSKTPIKFAPSAPPAQKSLLFGNQPSVLGGAVFAPKSAPSNIFGAAKEGLPSAEQAPPVAGGNDGGKDGGESDKENESQPSKKSLLEPKAPAASSTVASSLFAPKPAEAEAGKKPAEAPTASPSLLGAAAKPDSTPETATASSSLFGTSSQTPSAAPAAPAVPSSLFGQQKPAPSEKPAESEAPKASPLFGGQSTTSALGGAGAATSLFGAKPATAAVTGLGGAGPTSSLFGNASTAFGSNSTGLAAAGAAPPASAEAPAKPLFSFGSAPAAGDASSTQKAVGPPSGMTSNLFGGSPMKQDEPSPAKKPAMGSGSAGSSAPLFSFSSLQAPGAGPASTQGPAGATPATASSPALSGMAFGGAAGSSSNAAPGGFNFSFGGGSAGASSGGATSAFHNPFASNAAGASGASTGAPFNFAASSSSPAPFSFGGAAANPPAAAPSAGAVFGAGSSTAVFTGAPSSGGPPSFNFVGAPSQPPQAPGSVFGSNQAALQLPAGGSSTTGTNSPLNLGGGSSLATTPAALTPEPADGDGEEGEKHEQINLTDGLDADEEVLHEVRAKVLQFVPPSDKSDKDEESDKDKDKDKDKAKSKSPWSTKGIGNLRLLKHKESGVVRLLLRTEPRGHVAFNRALLPNRPYKADAKYVKLMTSNEKGDGLETWMVQVKTNELAKELAKALEENKEANKEANK
ncbi:nucleoporin nsp1 [Drechmeria coniospora]|uniref:Nucleoporin nsp1 n=1 Tax=Drechmeria coniospora TaxID=98403 RepID=A0A151GMM9_DRECN|nr:nucleoporin nsp1 [Drechmeria coniospora]KYK58367.1 nucleoporin nsp1 [Drechmeria coniospora]